MKVSVVHIIIGHFKTLWVGASFKSRAEDTFIFLLVPIIIGFSSVFVNINISKDFYNLSITFFGIFIALLLNIQVAIFGLFQRNWRAPHDDILLSQQIEKLEQRRKLLGQVNTNVSYLIVLSCLCLVANIGLFVFDANNSIARIISALLYSHFMLTLLMIIKRTHALFQKEYDVI